MVTQNPNRLRTNRPGGSLILGGDTTVNRLGFGAMRLCGPEVWGEPLDLPGAKRVLMRVVELGITLIDTADAYGPEVNERFIAETLYPYPKGLIIATKGGLVRPRREAWEENGRPEHLCAACEASLRRLKLERIDIYQLHAPDPQVPLEESVDALAKLQRRQRFVTRPGRRHRAVARTCPARCPRGRAGRRRPRPCESPLRAQAARA